MTAICTKLHSFPIVQLEGTDMMSNMGSKIFLLLLSILSVVDIATANRHRQGEVVQRHHRHHNRTRRVPSQLADMKDHIFHGYDASVNSDSQVVVKTGFTLLDLHLCGHKQVRVLLPILYSK